MTIPPRPGKCWIAVAAASHVAIGRAQGFMQVNHGKSAPLGRIQPGDTVICYAPTHTYGAKDRLQAFVAYGTVAEAPIYQGTMAGDFRPYRRDVRWHGVQVAPIAPLTMRHSPSGAKGLTRSERSSAIPL